jgi:hypothetical protein
MWVEKQQYIGNNVVRSTNTERETSPFYALVRTKERERVIGHVCLIVNSLA